MGNLGKIKMNMFLLTLSFYLNHITFLLPTRPWPGSCVATKFPPVEVMQQNHLTFFEILNI